MIGQTISHYRIFEKLGRGGMGVVYRAEDTSLRRFVVLKFLPNALSKDSQALARFQREAQAASALNYPRPSNPVRSTSRVRVARSALLPTCHLSGKGKELDARTDLSSFGAVLYEMAAGQLPFHGDTSALIFKAILDSDPPPAIRLL
jgi:serine/threonine protein kinase